MEISSQAILGKAFQSCEGNFKVREPAEASRKKLQGKFREKRALTPVLDLLESKIEEKEKRKVSLSFYRYATLRIVRNKLEHEGYKQSVTKDDVLNLANEIEKFGAELHKS